MIIKRMRGFAINAGNKSGLIFDAVICRTTKFRSPKAYMNLSWAVSTLTIPETFFTIDGMNRVCWSRYFKF